MKDFLWVLASIGQRTYTLAEKQALLDLVEQIALDELGVTKARYDIEGSGFGSRGAPSMLAKTFHSRLGAKGLDGVFGATVAGVGGYAGFILLVTVDPTPRIDLQFSWPPAGVGVYRRVLHRIRDAGVAVDYAYGYPDDDTRSEIGEWRTVQVAGGSRSSLPDLERAWKSRVAGVPSGRIKQIYPVNVFNTAQLAALSDITPTAREPYAPGLELWFFDPEAADLANHELGL